MEEIIKRRLTGLLAFELYAANAPSRATAREHFPSSSTRPAYEAMAARVLELLELGAQESPAPTLATQTAVVLLHAGMEAMERCT